MRGCAESPFGNSQAKAFPVPNQHTGFTAQHRAEYVAVVVLWNGTHSHLTRESLPEEQRQNPEQLFGRWMGFACIGDSHQQSLTELLSLDDHDDYETHTVCWSSAGAAAAGWLIIVSKGTRANIYFIF